MTPAFEPVRNYLIDLQHRITTALTELDGQGSFISDAWEKPPGEMLQGNGITKIMEQGAVFERALLCGAVTFVAKIAKNL